MTDPQWQPVDRYRPTRETRAIAEATEAGRTVEALLAYQARSLLVTLDLMREWANDGVKATRTNPGPRPQPLWCEKHNHDRSRCDDPTCVGIPYDPGSDPVGELATAKRDRATIDRDDLVHLLATRARLDRRIAAIATRYTRPTSPTTSTGPGPSYCASCFRFRRTLTPVDLRPDGRPRYTHLCRRCGEFRAVEGVMPPLAVLEAWHTPGGRTTRAMVDRALQRPPQRRTGRTG